MNILYEDSEILVVDKPAGMLVHPDGHTKNKTVSEWLLEEYPETRRVGEPLTLKDGSVIERPGVVHRLDGDTSGVLVLAKTKEAHTHLKEQFQNRTVTKVYYAITYGAPKEEQGIITAPIGRSSKDFRLRSAQRGARGHLREAETRYQYEQVGSEYALVRLEPKTGRTHQLRVHLKYIHHPIMCDLLYAPQKECGLEMGRLALHAASISFKNMHGEQVTVEAPYPEDFKRAVDLLA